MKITPLKIILLALCLCTQYAAQAASEWPLRLGIQTYTMRGLSLVQALDEAAKLGIDYVQIYPDQSIGEGFGTRKVNHSMTSADRARLLQIAKEKGVLIGSYGVVNGKDSADWEAIFEFAKSMGMESVAVDPKREVWPTTLAMIMSLSQKYGITFGIHNDVSNVSPEQALAGLAEINPHLPLFADTANWVRSGYDPVAGLAAAKGRLAGVQMGDVDEQSPAAIDTAWGQGIGYISGQLAELRKQKFSGVIFIEFGIGEMNPELQQLVLEQVAASKGYFDRAEDLSTVALIEGEVVPPGFVAISKVVDIEPKNNSGQWPQPEMLFDTGLDNAVQPATGRWKWDDGVLSGNGSLLSKADYVNYIINLEFKAKEGGLGAVVLNAPDGDIENALRVVIRQGDHGDDKQLSGAIDGVAPALRPLQIEAGKWYRMMVVVNRGSVTVTLEGDTMAEMLIRNWKTVGKNPDGTDNSYTVPVSNLLKLGKVGLSDTGGAIEYRNITIETF